MWIKLCLGVIVLLLTVVGKGFCTVRCYSCSSKLSRDCIKPEENQVSLMKCDIEALEKTRQYATDIDRNYDKIFEVDATEAGRLDLSCIKVVTRVGQKEIVLRGCQLAEQRNLDICTRLRQQDSQMVHVVQCSKCTHDHCNSSTRNNVNFVHFVLVFVVYKVFYTT